MKLELITAGGRLNAIRQYNEYFDCKKAQLISGEKPEFTPEDIKQGILYISAVGTPKKIAEELSILSISSIEKCEMNIAKSRVPSEEELSVLTSLCPAAQYAGISTFDGGKLPKGVYYAELVLSFGSDIRINISPEVTVCS